MKYNRLTSPFNFIIISLLFACAIWLFTHSQFDYQGQHARIEKVLTLQQETINLTRKMLLIESGELTHFDYLASSERQIESMMGDFNSSVSKEFTDSVNQMVETVFQTKSTFAIYHNSLLFFPKGIALLRSKLSATQWLPLMNKLNSLERAVMQFNISASNKQTKEELKNQIQLLIMYFDKLPQELVTTVNQLIRHAEVLIDYSQKIQLLNKQLLSNHITSSSQELMDSYHVSSQIDAQQASTLKGGFYFTLLILSLFILSIWWKQKNKMVTELQNSTEKVKLSARVFSDMNEGITITTSDGTIIDVNPTFCEITGYSREEIIGQNPRILSSGKQSPEFYQEMWRTILDQGHWQGEVWNRKKGGELYAERLTISSLKDDDGKLVNYIGLFSDITHSKKQQEKLNLMAHYDVLTGLPNRTLYKDRFGQAIAHSNRTDTQLAICFLDLDNFKPVNDNFGHEVGDLLLIEVAKRITANIRAEDTVSRQGGDEFAILLGDIRTLTQCEQMLSRIHQSLARPYMINKHSINISASCGITLYPSDNSDLDTLVRHADQAMYQAKTLGKNQFHIFNTAEDQELVANHLRLQEIKNALDNGELCLYYQPKVNMVTGDVVGAEALMRWVHPEKGLIPPLDFLPLLDGTDLEIQVGDWVVRRAIQQLDDWQKHGINLEVSINIASHHLQTDTFITNLNKALARYPTVDSKYLQLEILESSALSDLDTISNIIKTCQKALGITIALDDFGTGYSSLTHLRSLTANTIKIDQSFVRDMLDDPNDYTIIDGIIGLSSSFNRSVIAEGVETTEHGLMLLMMGCEEAQGYSIAKPISANDFPEWLNSYIPNKQWSELGSTSLSKKENRIKLFRLITEHWKNSFVSNIQSLPEDIEQWPIINNNLCPCSFWIKKAMVEQLFEQEHLEQLDQAHDELHLIAHGLLLQYQDGDVDAARKGLPDLQTYFDNMNNVLKVCEPLSLNLSL